MKVGFGLALAALASGANAQVLWDNGPMATGSVSSNGTVAPSGTQWSELQLVSGTPANGTLGYSVNYQNATSTGPLRQADDFVVGGAGWQVSQVVVYGFRTNGSTSESFATAVAQIWNGKPGEVGSVVVAGDLTTNRLVSTTFTNLYRTGRANPSSTIRPIMAATLALPTTLSPGTYWLEYGLTGAGNIFSPLVTIPGQLTTPDANALLFTSGQYFTMTDTSSGVQLADPFQILGQPVPEPATLAGLGLACAALLRKRRRAA